jgi:hypothetical protein
MQAPEDHEDLLGEPRRSPDAVVGDADLPRAAWPCIEGDQRSRGNSLAFVHHDLVKVVRIWRRSVAGTNGLMSIGRLSGAGWPARA